MCSVVETHSSRNAREITRFHVIGISLPLWKGITRQSQKPSTSERWRGPWREARLRVVVIIASADPLTIYVIIASIDSLTIHANIASVNSLTIHVIIASVDSLAIHVVIASIHSYSLKIFKQYL